MDRIKCNWMLGRVLLMHYALPLMEWIGCHDNFNQPRRHVIDKPRNSPLARERVRLECSDIDGNRSPGIGDRFGLQFRFVNSKVAGQQVGFPCKAGDPAVGVMNNDEVPFAGSRSLNLGDCLEYGYCLQRLRSDPTTNGADHESIPELETQHISRIGTRIDTADDDRLRCRKEGHARGEPMRGEVVVALLQGVKSDHGVPPVWGIVRGHGHIPCPCDRRMKNRREGTCSYCCMLHPLPHAINLLPFTSMLVVFQRDK